MAGKPNYPTRVAVVIDQVVDGERLFWLDTELYKFPEAPVLTLPWAFIERYKTTRDEWFAVQGEIEKKVREHHPKSL